MLMRAHLLSVEGWRLEIAKICGFYSLQPTAKQVLGIDAKRKLKTALQEEGAVYGLGLVLEKATSGKYVHSGECLHRTFIVAVEQGQQPPQLGPPVGPSAAGVTAATAAAAAEYCLGGPEAHPDVQMRQLPQVPQAGVSSLQTPVHAQQPRHSLASRLDALEDLFSPVATCHANAERTGGYIARTNCLDVAVFGAKCDGTLPERVAALESHVAALQAQE